MSEKGSVFITIIIVIVVAGVMFIFPFMATSKQNDSIMQSSAQAIVSDFVNTAAREGKLTQDNIDSCKQKLSALGAAYDLQLEVMKLDDNPGSKGPTSSAIGQNLTVTDFNIQIEAEMDSDEDGIPDQPYKLEQGYIIKATANRISDTTYEKVLDKLYSMLGTNTSQQIISSALVTTTDLSV